MNYYVIKANKNRYNEISFFKGFAIITIVLMHFLQNGYFTGVINTALSFGGTGVHLFFFCSGFGLYHSHLKNKQTFFRFIRKRFLKVYVPYVIIVFISSFLPYMYEGDRFKALLSHVFLYKMFSVEYESSLGPQFWYVSTLFQFYFVFHLLVWIKEKTNNVRIFFGIALLLSLVWWCFSVQTGIAEERIWGSFFLQYLWEFVLGMIIADRLTKRDMVFDKKILFAVSVIGIIIAGIAKMEGGIWVSFNDVFASFGYGSFALFLYSINIWKINELICSMSIFSYELYLVHMLIFYTILSLYGNSICAVVLSLFVSVLCAIGFHKVIERFDIFLKSEIQHKK